VAGDSLRISCGFLADLLHLPSMSLAGFLRISCIFLADLLHCVPGCPSNARNESWWCARWPSAGGLTILIALQNELHYSLHLPCLQRKMRRIIRCTDGERGGGVQRNAFLNTWARRWIAAFRESIVDSFAELPG
jgi:hypothetical protein